MIPKAYLGVDMHLKILSVAMLAISCGLSATQAVAGPANLPPAGFTGQQFVDNKGCIYMRAGYGGQVTWVARISANRQPLCGQPPSFGARPVIEVAEAPVFETRPKNPGPPMETIASLKTPPKLVVRQPDVVIATQVPQSGTPSQTRVYDRTAVRSTDAVFVASSAPGRAGKIGCYTSAPVLQRVRLRTGGTALVCTPGDGTLTGWRPPVFPAGSPVGVALSDANIIGVGRAAQTYQTAVAADAVPTPPQGYKLAWNDDRLNPLRGKGTVEGQAAQDAVWTRKVPAKLVVADRNTVKRPSVTVSTKSQATAPVEPGRTVAAGRAFVQVGTFGVPSNAQGAVSRLSSLGLPVARAKTVMGGKQVVVVYAGPFASAAEAQRALNAARGAGFGDAFIK